MPDKIWRKKEYLQAEGRIAQIGRGRISADNHAFLEKAVESGVKFSDYGPQKVIKTKVAGRVVEKVVRTVTEVMVEYRGQEDYRFPESIYKVVDMDGNDLTNITLKSACNNCGYSLVDHRCEEPRALDIPVMIVRK